MRLYPVRAFTSGSGWDEFQNQEDDFLSKGIVMKTCGLSDFMESLRPWLSSSYIRAASLDEKGCFVLDFTDGIRETYRIDDCDEAQLRGILGDLEREGVKVER